MTAGVYILQCCWAYDNQNQEYATITLETPEKLFENMTEADVEGYPSFDRITKGVCPGHGSKPEPVRLYMVTNAPLGFPDLTNSPTGPAIKFHLELKPLFDFLPDGKVRRCP